VFSSSIAIVMGPLARHRRDARGSPEHALEIHVAASLPSASRLMPTSMTTAPGFTMPAVTSLASGRHHENVRLAGHRAQIGF